ncbi:MAG: putative transcriptional regulator [Candidatus Eremiobacteraeota bacterium]|nr:putative transcriptional regulator [Candidatus Eremiobacteraeota bacterium]
MLAVASPESTTIARDGLLDAVRLARPRLVILFAPAGYGKSTFARQIATEAAPAIEIDCESERDGVDLALRIAGAPSASAIVLENAQAHDDCASGLLAPCVETVGVDGIVVVCTRSRLDVAFSRALLPTDVMTIGEDELRFSRAEIARVAGVTEPGDLDAVERLTAGWPIAVAMCRRAARLGKLDSLLHDPQNDELEGLEGYIASEVIGSLGDAEMEALCVLSHGGIIDTASLSIALRTERRNARQIVRNLPLVWQENGVFVVHELLARLLVRCHPERRRAAAGAAVDALVEAGEDVIAARLALASGDMERAASALKAGVLLVSAPSGDVAELTQALDAATLLRFPRLWNTAILFRVGSLSEAEWRAESLAVWSQLSPDAGADEVLGVANNVAMMLVTSGEWEQLEAFRRESAQRLARAGITKETERAVAALLDGLVAAARLYPLDLDRFAVEVTPLLGIDYVQAVALRDVVAPIRGRSGDRDGEREVLEDAIRAATRSGIAPVLGMCLQEAAIAAWLNGEDQLFEQHVAEIEELGRRAPSLREITAHFIACVHGEGLTQLVRGTRPANRALSLLIGAERTPELTVRRAIVQHAIAAADASRRVRPMILTRLAAAHVDERQRFRLDEARAIVKDLRGPTIWHRHFVSSDDASPLAPFIRRFRPRASERDRVRVMLLRGLVRVGETDIAFSKREFGVLAHLALQNRLVDIDAAIDELWPEARGLDGVSSLRVYVNRIRKRLRDPSAIVSSKRAYGVGAHVTTDIGEAERFVAKSLPVPRASAIEPLLTLRAALAAGPPAFVADIGALRMVHPRVNALLDRLDEALAERREDLPPDLRARIDAALDEGDRS